MKKVVMACSWLFLVSTTVYAANGDLLVNGSIGVGTTVPATKMDVNGEVRIGNSGLLCSASTEGAVRYNAISKGMEFCNGTDWMAFGASSTTPPDAYTTLLLHMNSDFSDSSLSPKTPTVSGATINTSEKKFGIGSGYFNGSSFVSFADSDEFSFGSDNFTIDFWFRGNANTFSTNNGLLGKGANSTGYGEYLVYKSASSNMLYLYSSTSGSSWNFINGLSIGATDESWHHYAIVRNGNVVTTYRDGVATGSVSISGSFANYSTPLMIGRYDSDGPGLSPRYLNGYLDELRISKGVARWTTPTFPLPTAPY